MTTENDNVHHDTKTQKDEFFGGSALITPHATSTGGCLPTIQEVGRAERSAHELGAKTSASRTADDERLVAAGEGKGKRLTGSPETNPTAGKSYGQNRQKNPSRKRRGRGEGSIYQRTDGLWIAARSLGYDAQGKRIRKIACGTTKAEAQEGLQKLLQSGPLDLLGDSEKVPLAKYLEQWLETVVKPHRTRNTYVCYRCSVVNHINPKIGGVLLTKLTSDHVAGLYAAMKTAGASARTRQLAHSVLHRALEVAVRSRPPKIAGNPCDHVEAPKVPANKRHRVEPYTRDEVERLFAACMDGRAGALIILTVLTGLRQGELFGLYWTDINLEEGWLSVSRSLEEVEGILAIKDTKSSRGRRVDLPPEAVEALYEHKKRMLAEGHLDGPVFCDQKGGWLRKSNFRRRVWHPLCKAAGLPRRRFHDLRHTHATLLLELGVHPKIVQERLGHSRIGIVFGVGQTVLIPAGFDGTERSRSPSLEPGDWHPVTVSRAQGHGVWLIQFRRGRIECSRLPLAQKVENPRSD
jgi:integrase